MVAISVQYFSKLAGFAVYTVEVVVVENVIMLFFMPQDRIFNVCRRLR